MMLSCRLAPVMPTASGSPAASHKMCTSSQAFHDL
jgi:hypothetical protein